MVIGLGTTVYDLEGAEWEVVSYLGRGSFGAVYEVKERRGARTLAIKTILTAFSHTKDFKTFLNEGRIALGIRHANVIEYMFFHDGSMYGHLPPYILMEYARDGTLEQELDRARSQGKLFTTLELFGMFRQLTAGMHAINAKLVHRDIKPDNILISDGVLKITDFGLAKVVIEATRNSTFKGFGCVAYMAPEAWRLEKNTIQMDIYAMGMVFYQLATLRYPFDLRTPEQHKWMEAHLYQPVLSPEVHNPALGPQLTQIIMKMVAKDTETRFKDWAGIEKLLLQSERPTGESSDSLVAAMLQRRLQQDVAAEAAESKNRQEIAQQASFCKLVISQAQQALISPLERLILEFNDNYAGAKTKITGSSDTTGLSYRIFLPSGKTFTIDFRVLLDTDFVQEVRHDNYGRTYQLTEIRIPHFTNRRVQGWGVLKGSDGKGFNVVLLEKPEQIYGEFLLFLNKAGFFQDSERRPEPFPFEFDELEREIQLVGAMHIYSTTVNPLTDVFLSEFVATYV